jgi:putative oxidoreductase
MSTQTISNVAASQQARVAGASVSSDSAGGLVTVVGRFLFSVLFLLAGPMHFSKPEINAAMAAGVPFAKLVVPASGVLAFVAALSVLLGYHAKIGGWLLVLFLVPVTLAMHNFWAVQDPMMQQIQMVMFLKNVSMLGAALLITQFGAGAWSLDARRAARDS